MPSFIFYLVLKINIYNQGGEMKQVISKLEEISEKMIKIVENLNSTKAIICSTIARVDSLQNDADKLDLRKRIIQDISQCIVIQNQALEQEKLLQGLLTEIDKKY